MLAKKEATKLPRKLFNQDHHLFRESVKRFMQREVAPFHEQWERQGQVSRELWLKAGAAGLLCPTLPERYGGLGLDYGFNVIVDEELATIVASGPGFMLHSDIVAYYLLNHGSETLKSHWLPKMITGEMIGAIAMTEPGTGSDLQSVKTTAIKSGDHYLINGAKTFITNGQMADFVIVVCKTDPSKGAKGISLVLVEADRAGFARGKNLNKLGLKAQDTAELFFNDVQVPLDNLLGEAGKGFNYLMHELPRERLCVAVYCQASAEAAYDYTLEYISERKAFGKPIVDFQNSRFTMAEMKTRLAMGRAFIDQCIELILVDQLDASTAAMAKLGISEMLGEVADQCLQLHGGYGYMLEFPVARIYADARVQRIFAGTSEIMKELIGRHL